MIYFDMCCLFFACACSLPNTPFRCFFNRGTVCKVFEGHSHYVMMVKFNLKDSNTFASASLDRCGAREYSSVAVVYATPLLLVGLCVAMRAALTRLLSRVPSNQDLIWCVKRGVYMGFWVHRGS